MQARKATFSKRAAGEGGETRGHRSRWRKGLFLTREISEPALWLRGRSQWNTSRARWRTGAFAHVENSLRQGGGTWEGVGKSR